MSTISIIIFRTSKIELQQRLTEKLQIINDLKIERIKSHFKNVKYSINHIEYDYDLQDHIIASTKKNSTNDSLVKKAKISEQKLYTAFKSLEKTYSFNRIMLKKLDGTDIIKSKKIKNLEKNDSLLYKTNTRLFINAQKGFEYSDIYHPIGKDDEFYLTVMAPFFENKNESDPIAIICCEIPMTPIYNSISDTTGLGKTGETILTKRTYNNVHFISKPRGYIGDYLKKTFSLNTNSSDKVTVEQLSVLNRDTKHNFSFEIKDYKGNIVDAAWDYIPNLNWGITTKIDHKESFTSIQNLKAIIIMLCAGILFFAIIIITIFVERFLTPIINIRNNLVSLSKGMFPKNLNYDMSDEIHDTTIALNNLVERLKNSTDFAKRIGAGDLNAEYHGQQSQDVLSQSLLSMQNSLKSIEEENNRRKWATEGIAKHSDLFRKNSSSIEGLGNAFIQSLVQYINGVHGAVYTINHIGSNSGVILLDQGNLYFELIGTYAYDIKEDTPRKFRLGQGLVGQSAKEKKSITIEHSTQIMSTISSGLGKSRATHILCVPMIVNDQVMGVVELSNFKPFPQHVITFIETLGESFASAILNVKSTFQTQDTLKEFENTTSELLQKQEELTDRYTAALDEIKTLKEKVLMSKNTED